LLEAIPEITILSSESFFPQGKHGVKFNVNGKDGKGLYSLVYIQDYEKTGKPALFLGNYCDTSLPNTIVEKLELVLKTKHNKNTGTGDYIWSEFNESEKLPELRNPNDLDLTHLYLELRRMVTTEVADPKTLRFTKEQIAYAFNQQGILGRNYDAALNIALSNKMLIQHEKGFGITSEGLATYYKTK
jgi:hypothetical protein